MSYEVEQKHRVHDAAGLMRQLTDRGVVLEAGVTQIDKYFAHPCRDFARTDEALRIRTVGGGSYVTYKGPKLGGPTKTRRELELPLGRNDVDGGQMAELLAALGFGPVATVRKERRSFEVRHQGQRVVGALDEVDGLGSFVELELIADEAGLDAARNTISDLAADLKLGPIESGSYLEMLLAK
jgi:adenylate cyclase class 2